MKTCYFTTVLVLVIAARSVAGAGICDYCLCDPKDAPVSVTCNCKSPETVLELKPQDFNEAFKNTKNFSISNCDSTITFKRNLFKDFQSLDNLKIQNVKQVVFEMGVFHKLNHLNLRNITELNFKTNAFHGGDMKSVKIHHSSIDILPEYAFHDLDSLEKFSLSDVHINSIERNSIMLKNNKEVEITNTTADKIASNGMTIAADTVVIYKCHMNNISANALNITAKNQLVISQSEFDRDLPDNPIIANSPIVNISNNIFQRITPQIIRNFKGNPDSSILFINNTIHEIKSQDLLNIPSSAWTFTGNQFNCSCDMLRLFENLKKSDIVNNNFCLLRNCRVTLSHSADKCARQSPANLDDTDLCQGIVTVPPREGKKIGDLPTPQRSEGEFVTHIPTTTPRSSASITLASTFIFWGFIASILI